ncbi:hypothetical protein [Dactylosporangium maewongense]
MPTNWSAFPRSAVRRRRCGPTLMIEAIRAAMAGDTLISPR